MTSSDKKSPVGPAVLIVGHGSRLPGFEAPMKRLADGLRRTHRYSEVVCAYLEMVKPSLREAIDRAVARGVKEVRVLPYFLLKGRHTLEDIPGIVGEARAAHRLRARIVLCPYLGFDERLVAIAEKRLKYSTRKT